MNLHPYKKRRGRKNHGARAAKWKKLAARSKRRRRRGHSNIGFRKTPYPDSVKMIGQYKDKWEWDNPTPQIPVKHLYRHFFRTQHAQQPFGMVLNYFPGSRLRPPSCSLFFEGNQPPFHPYYHAHFALCGRGTRKTTILHRKTGRLRGDDWKSFMAFRFWIKMDMQCWPEWDPKHRQPSVCP